MTMSKMITISNGYLSAVIDEKGAQLTSLRTAENSYIYNDLAVWPKHAPVLFPFAGRLYEQKFLYDGREYGPVQIHGFAPYADYSSEELTDQSVRMKMIVSDEIRRIWPFTFGFSVLFTLRDKTLFVTYRVENKGDRAMYYGIGSHPGFNVPLKAGLAFEDYFVEFPEAGTVVRHEMSDVCLTTGRTAPYSEIRGKRIPLRHDLFDHDAVILSGTGKTAVIATDRDSCKVIVTFPETQYCALWHKVRMEVPFLCIEPWTSLPGFDHELTSLEKKRDYNVLKPASFREHHLNITIME